MLPIPLAFICAIALSTLIPHTYYDHVDEARSGFKKYWGNHVTFFEYAQGEMDKLVMWPFISSFRHHRMVLFTPQEEKEALDLQLQSILDALEDHRNLDLHPRTAHNIGPAERYGIVFQTLREAPLPESLPQPSQDIIDAQDISPGLKIVLMLSAGLISIGFHGICYLRQRRLRLAYLKESLSQIHNNAGPWILNPTESSVTATSPTPSMIFCGTSPSGPAAPRPISLAAHESSALPYFGRPLATVEYENIPQAMNKGVLQATTAPESSNAAESINTDAELVDGLPMTEDDSHVSHAPSLFSDSSFVANDVHHHATKPSSTDPIGPATPNNDMVLQRRIEELEARIQDLTSHANADAEGERESGTNASPALNQADDWVKGKHEMQEQHEPDHGMPLLTDEEGENDDEDDTLSTLPLRLYQPNSNAQAARMHRRPVLLAVDSSSIMDLKKIETIIFLVNNDTLFWGDQFLVASRRRPHHRRRPW